MTPDENRWSFNLKFPRRPDLNIGPESDVYMRRWVLLISPWLRVYVHQFLRSDDDRALHDHPAHHVSVILRGRYTEVTPEGRFHRRAFVPIFREASALHRVELVDGKPVWTLLIRGPKVREWGFACPQGWRHWTDYVSVRDGGNEIGKGCE